MKSFVNSKCGFMRFIGLLQIHIVLLFGFLIIRGQSLSTARSTTRSSGSGCPLTATKLFFGKQIAFIGESITSSSIIPKMLLGGQGARDVMDTNWRPSKISSLSSKEFRTITMSATTTDAPVKAEKVNKKASGPLEVTVIGLSHHNAVVDVREKLAIPEDQWATAASSLCEYSSVAEAAVLSTCNR